MERWNVVDPHAENYYGLTGYSYTANNPILYTDPNGKDIVLSYRQGDETKTYTYSYEKNRKFDKNASEFLKNTIQSLDHLYTNKALDVTVGEGKDSKTLNVLETVIDDNENHLLIKEGAGFFYRNTEKTIYFAGNKAGEFRTDINKGYDATNSPASLLDHEIFHGYNDIYDNSAYSQRKEDKTMNTGKKGDFPNAEERYVITNLENQMNTKLNEPKRTNYTGNLIPASRPTSNKRK